MDSSTDGSFAWTDASNDTIESESIIDGDMTKRNSVTESDPDKKYKKILQDELFNKNNGVVNGEERMKYKDKKRKGNQCASEHSMKSDVKREPESDIDTSTKKHNVTNGHNESDSYDESYLELKVKAEQRLLTTHSLTKHKGNRQLSLSDTEILQEEPIKEKKEQSKRKNKNSVSETECEDEKLNILVKEETERTKKNKKKSKKRKRSIVDDNTGEDEQDCSIEKSLSQHLSAATDSSSLSHSVPLKRISRVSDRIQFEEDEVLNVDTEKQSTMSSKLKRFVKSNLNLKVARHLDVDSAAALSAENDLWLVRCPRDVPIEAFTHKDISLEEKCKLKLNGQTYEGIVHNDSENVSVLSSDRDCFIIKSLMIKGCVHLRKRIPKSHIREDALANSNPVSFIPLPETKCRHPLLGAHYKKDIKLSSRVSQRLDAAADAGRTRTKPSRDAEHADNACGRNRTKRPRDVEPDAVAADHTPIKRKKKKRKLSIEDDAPAAAPSLPKRQKRDLESAETWDSEQAIEEKLFNF